MQHSTTVIRPSFSLPWLCLTVVVSAISPATRAQVGYDQQATTLCKANSYPRTVFPEAVPASEGSLNCLVCHQTKNPSTNAARNTYGDTWASRDQDQGRVLSAFCSSDVAAESGVSYNQNPDGALPAVWRPSSPNLVYSGNLESYWHVQMDTDAQTRVISSSRAAAVGAAPLTVSPDNCWGHSMNFGLISLAKAATLTVTMSGENGASITPGFALYQGWDSSQSSSRHAPIYFGDNNLANGRIDANPLGTAGLGFIGDKLGAVPGTPISKSFQLSAGNYELFVTVGDNTSSSGPYELTLTTSPLQASADGVCGTANGHQFSNAASPQAGELCLSGEAGTLTRAKFGRDTWACFFSGPQGSSTQCYTAGNNGKSNQSALTLSPGDVTIRSGQTVTQRAIGGSGPGAIRFRKLPSPGLKCTMITNGKKVRVKVKGSGTCRMYATKGASRLFNDVQSPPLTITVIP